MAIRTPSTGTTEENVANSLNRPLFVTAIAVMAIGLILSLTIALLPLGVVVMALGAVWATILYWSAKARA